MKKALWVPAVLVVVCFYYSCTKDKTLPPVSTTCVGVDSVSNTYDLRIKAILDASCAYVGCHNTVVPQGNIILSTYSDAKTSFETKNALCSIKQEGTCLPMPDGAPKLADSLITYIQCWAENGYPQ